MIHATALALAILLTIVAQLTLKVGVSTGKRRLFIVMGGYSTLAAATVSNLFAMRGLPLTTIVTWSAVSYPVVTLASAWYLREPIGRRHIIGAMLIMIGIGAATPR